METILNAINKLSVFLVLLLFVTNAASVSTTTTSTSTSAAVQATAFSVVPANIAPGSAGKVILTLTNSGSANAQSVYVYYTDPKLGSSSVAVGSIGAGGSSLVTVPFTIPADTAPGITTITFNVQYQDSGTGSVLSTTVSVPVTVTQPQNLQVSTLKVDKQAISPGDSVTITLALQNLGDRATNVILSIPQNSSFSINGASNVQVGTLDTGATKTINVPISSTSSATPGKYQINLQINYLDSLGNANAQQVSIGPIVVAAPSNQLITTLTETSPAEIGSEANFYLTVQNIGTSSVSDITVEMNTSSVFTLLGQTKIYIGILNAGENKTIPVTLGITAGTAPGYYSAVFTTKGNGDTLVSTNTFGILTKATTSIVISSDMSPAFVTPGSGVTLTIQVSNNGNSTIRSVYVQAVQPSSRAISISGANDKFIGTLNVDDFSTMQLNILVPPNTQPGDYNLTLTIDYKDVLNNEIRQNKEISIHVSGAQEAAIQGATGTFQGRRANSNPLNSIYVQIGLAVVAILLIYAFYRFYWKKRGKK